MEQPTVVSIDRWSLYCQIHHCRKWFHLSGGWCRLLVVEGPGLTFWLGDQTTSLHRVHCCCCGFVHQHRLSPREMYQNSGGICLSYVHMFHKSNFNFHWSRVCKKNNNIIRKGISSSTQIASY